MLLLCLMVGSKGPYRSPAGACRTIKSLNWEITVQNEQWSDSWPTARTKSNRGYYMNKFGISSAVARDARFLVPLDFYLTYSAGGRSVCQGKAKLGSCRCWWSTIAGGFLLARRAGGATCSCPVATCYRGHSIQLNSCQSQLGGMCPPGRPSASFFCVFLFMWKNTILFW